MTENLLSSDIFKNVLDIVSNLFDKLNNIPTAGIVALGAAILVVGRQLASTLITGVLQPITQGISSIGKKFEELKEKSIIKGKVSLNESEVKKEVQNIIGSISEIENKSPVVIDVIYKESHEDDSDEQGLKDLDIITASSEGEQDESPQFLPFNSSEVEDEVGTVVDITVDAMDEVSIAEDDMNDKTEESKEKTEKAGLSIGDAFSTVATQAATAAVMIAGGADTSTVFFSTLASGLTSILPQFVKLISAVIAGNTTAAATEWAVLWPLLLIVAGVAALAAGVALVVAAYNKWNSGKVSNQLSELNDKIEEQEENITSLKSSYSDLSESADTLEDIQDIYEDLNGKTILSDEEQEEWDDMIETLQNEYPELISYYNEETGQLRLHNELLDEKIESLNQEAELAARATASQTVYTENLQNQADVLSTMQGVASDLSFSENSDTYSSTDYSDYERFGEDYAGLISAAVEKSNVSVEVTNYTDDSYGGEAWFGGTTAEGITLSSRGTSFTVDQNSLLSYYQDNIDSEVEELTDAQMKQLRAIYSYAFTGNEQVLDGYEEVETLAKTMRETVVDAAQELEDLSFDFYNLFDSISTYVEEKFPDLTESEQAVLSSEATALIDEYNDKIDSYLSGKFGSSAQGNEDKAENAYEDMMKDLAEEFGTTADELKKVTFEYTTVGGQDSTITASRILDQMEGISNGWNQTNWSSLTNDEKNALSAVYRDLAEAQGQTVQEYYEEVLVDLDDAEFANNFYQQAMSMILTQLGVDLESTDISSLLTDFYSEFTTNFDEMTASEYQDYLSEYVTSELGYNNLADFWKNATEDEKAIVNELVDAENYTNDGIFEQLSEYGLNYDNLTMTAVDAISNYFANMGEEYETGAVQLEEKQRILANSLNSITEDFSDEVSNVVIGFDFTALDSYESKSDLREALIDLVSNEDLEGALGKQEAEAFADEYIATLEAADLADFTIKTMSGVEQSLDDLFDGLSDDLDSITGAVEELIDSVTDEDYNTGDLYEYLQELNEAGDFDWTDLDEWVELDENGEVQIKVTGGELVETQIAGVLDDLEDSYNDIMNGTRDGIEEIKEEIESLERILNNIEVGQSYTVQEFADATKIDPETAAQLLADSGATEDVYSIDSNQKITISQETYNYFENTLTSQELAVSDMQEWYNGEQDTGTLKAFLEQVGTDEVLSQLYDMQDEYQDAVDDALKDVEDAEESVADAEESLAEAEEKLADALEDYSELLYGSDNRASTLDNLYNYTEAINSYTNAASRAEDELSDATTIEEATQAWQDYANAYHNVIAYTEAESQVIEEALANYSDWIENATSSYVDEENGNTITINYSDYVTYDENTGKYVLDQQLLNQAEFNDDYKELLETQVENYNKYSEELLSLEEQQKEAEEALQEARKQAYQDYASMEEEIASVLQEQYQDEIDALEEKYEAMEEADSDYLDALKDAIDKQRELRDQENEYEDLAQQERKLALMQRDTSGANQTEVMELEDEVEESRQDLLDEEVDNILDNMEEMNDNISELHETEIELKQAILDNTAYWNSQAETIAASFTSAEDYVAWMTENSTEFIESTMTEQIVLMDEWTDTATAALTKYAIDGSDTIESYVTVTADEVATIVNTTGEALTTEVTRQANETTTQVTEDLEAAINSIDDARKSVADAEDALNNANLALSNAQSNLSNATTNLNTFNSTLQDTIALIEEFEITSGDTDTSSPGGTGTYTSGTHIDQSYAGSSSASVSKTPEDSDGNAYQYRGYKSDGSYIYSNNLTSLQNAGAEGYWSLDSINSLLGTNYTTWPSSGTFYSSDNNLWTIGGWFNEITGNGTSWRLSDENTKDVSDSLLYEFLGDGTIYAHKFASGGLVDYTGPAWVDGTPSSPEAFLSAEDTERIGRAAEILADLPLLNSTSSTDNINSTSYGDTTIEINLNIDSLSSDVDVDNMIELMKQEIVDAANPVGSSNILTKSY